MSQCNVNESLMESQKENTIENVDNSTNVSYTWHPDNDLENEECHLFDDNIKQELRSTPNLYNENPDQNNATEYISCEQGEDSVIDEKILLMTDGTHEITMRPVTQH